MSIVEAKRCFQSYTVMHVSDYSFVEHTLSNFISTIYNVVASILVKTFIFTGILRSNGAYFPKYLYMIIMTIKK